MRISWKWLSELVDVSGLKGPEDLADRLTARGLEVESVDRQDKGFDKVVTAQILERNPHPQSDRLSLCKVSLGSGNPLEIVCGAQNMKAGDKVALAQIGADLPNGLKIAESKIRGVTSYGMLCSEEELKLKDTSEGILILPASTPLGKPLAEILGRADTILSFKLTANRGDCLSHFGLAREVGAMLGKKPKEPEYTALSFAANAAELKPIAIKLDAGESAPQFVGALIEGVKIGPSPDWVVKRLEALGSRSINNVVDASNLVMLELGHPTHAYDADLLEGGVLSVRTAKAGESLPLLDGTTVELTGHELVIADGKKAVGLAGVMGGGNSEVRDATKRIFLECAEFAASPVRRAASKHQKRTDAAHRFERGIDPNGAARAAGRVAKLIAEWAGGKVVTAGHAKLPSRANVSSKYDAHAGAKRSISVKPEYFADFLGMKVSGDEAERVLADLDCKITKGAEWKVEPPSYRLDLNIREDLAEEIARTLGYDRIESTVPPLLSMPQSASASESMAKLALVDRAKDALKRAGLAEVLNYSFTAKTKLADFGMQPSLSLINPLSEEWETLVPSLLPGLVQSALTNWNHHFGSSELPLRLFEIRPTFALNGAAAKTEGEMATNVVEQWKLAFLASGPRWSSALRNELGELDFSDVKSILEQLFEALGTRGVRLIPLSESRTLAIPAGSPGHSPIAQLFHPGQAVEILAGNQSAGFVGLFHPAKAKKLKTRAPIWLGELDWNALAKLSRPAFESRAFAKWPEFPAIERDYALVVGPQATADKITQLALKAGKPLAKVAKIFDVYRGSQVAEGMTSIAVRVIFYEDTRSLQESEAEQASAKILEAWKKELGAELRG